MAYTLNQPSNKFQPSENLSWYEADSTDKNESSFVYRFRVQVTDVDGTFTTGSTGSDVVGTFRIPPRPVTGVANFSANAIVKNSVNTPLDYTTDIVSGSTGDAIKQYRVIAGQEYLTTTGLTGMDSVTGAADFVWNAVIQDEDFPAYDQNDYVIRETIAGERHLLTDGPLTRCINTNDHLYTIAATGGDFGVSRNQVQLFGGNTVFQTGLSAWKQTLLYSPARSWYLIPPGFIYATAQAVFPVGEFSDVLYYDDAYTQAGAVFGPVTVGDSLTIQIQTPIPWAAQADTNALWLWGRNPDNSWEAITAMTKFSSGGGTILAFILSGYTFTKPYQYLGFAAKNEGYTYWPTLQSIINTGLNSSGLWWWKKHNSGSFFQPIDLPSVSWVNTGLNGMGQRAYFKNNLIPDDFYEVMVTDSEQTPYSESVLYEGDCSTCNSCEKVKLVWLNSLGGYDEFEFNCLQSKSLEAERVIGERTLTPTYTRGDRGRLNNANVAKRVKTVNTQFTTASDIDWLESLFMSPDVYEVTDTGVLTPVVIDSTSYSQFVNQDKLKIAEFTYSLGYNLKSQIF